MSAVAGRDLVERAADRFFALSAARDWDGIRGVIADDMLAWGSGGTTRQRFVDAIPAIDQMHERLGDWEYRDVRRVLGEDGFCEQHTVRFTRSDGKVREFAACVVATVGADGLITSLDEYIDPSRESTWASPQEES